METEDTTGQAPRIMELIANAPWREAVTYRDTWPHEYVVVKKDGQEELLAAFCERIGRGEGVECQFFPQRPRALIRPCGIEGLAAAVDATSESVAATVPQLAHGHEQLPTKTP